jgi:hypothetical protein
MLSHSHLAWLQATGYRQRPRVLAHTFAEALPPPLDFPLDWNSFAKKRKGIITTFRLRYRRPTFASPDVIASLP